MLAWRAAGSAAPLPAAVREGDRRRHAQCCCSGETQELGLCVAGGGESVISQVSCIPKTPPVVWSEDGLDDPRYGALVPYALQR